MENSPSHRLAPLPLKKPPVRRKTEVNSNDKLSLCKGSFLEGLFSFPPIVMTAGGAVGHTYRQYRRSLKHTIHFATIQKMGRAAGTFACARLSGAGQVSPADGPAYCGTVGGSSRPAGKDTRIGAPKATGIIHLKVVDLEL